MKKLDTPYTLKAEKEAAKALESLLNRKRELDEKEDILPFFKQYPALIIEMCRLVRMSFMTIDELEFDFQLSENHICDMAFGSSQKNTYCLVKFKDAKQNSVFNQNSSNYRTFSSDFEKANSQLIDWLWTIDDRKNRGELNHKFAYDNPDVSTILIIGRSEFLNAEERDRLEWRKEKTWVNSQRILCITYDDLFDCFQFLLEESENRLFVQ